MGRFAPLSNNVVKPSTLPIFSRFVDNILRIQSRTGTVIEVIMVLGFTLHHCHKLFVE